MANSFAHVNQALRIDNGLKSAAVLSAALLLIAGWATWSLAARLTRYEVSDSARLEINGSAYPVQSNGSGRVVSSQLELGRHVEAGEILVLLDDNDQRLTLNEQRTHLASLAPQVAALRAQLQTDRAGASDDGHVVDFDRLAAIQQQNQAQVVAAMASVDAERAAQLHQQGIISEADFQRAQADARSKHATAEALRAAAFRFDPALRVRERDRAVRLKQIDVSIAKLEAEQATTIAAIARLEEQRQERQIRAPIAGRLGECAILRPGAHISEGQQLGVILPPGRLQVVAEFTPSSALGKVRPGQRASVRLQGFPWAQYGTVPAQVSKVAGDIRDGKVRVELAVLAGAPARIPFQHGLPGSVEIEVERLSPAALVLRSAGQMLGAH